MNGLSSLWELADQFEDYSKDHQHYSPLQRYVWKLAWKELTTRLDSMGPRYGNA